MTEEDTDSLRPSSPYHEKCFPPYCDNAGKVDKQSVTKMTRKDLEDKYIVYADENFNLKKRIREHERHIQRLQTAMARQDSIDKRGGAKVPPSIQMDNARMDNLETQNKHLQAKVKVLKQQLMNHSFIHSKENKIAENKEKQYKNPDYFRDVGQTQSAREPKNRYKSPSPSARELNSNVFALKERIAELENMLETQKNKYTTRIAQLEKELSKSGGNLNEELSEHSRKVNDNVEIIKLRRDSKRMSEEIDSLNDQNEALRKELEELKGALKKADESVEELERMLERERERAKDAKSNLSKSVSHTETIRVLNEEIRDLKSEKKELKEANERLLLLTTTASKSDKCVASDSKLKQQDQEDEIKELKRKLKKALDEVEELKEIADYHKRNCLKVSEPERLRTPPSAPQATESEHEVEQVPVETATKAVLIIVSKHEFDAILLKKKKFYSQSEVMVPSEGQRPQNCKMEICIYDLEVDNRMVDHVSEMERDPQVYVVWNFLGLEQSTLAMPVTKAHFHTNVVYFGPLSEEMARHVQQREMPIHLMLVRAKGGAEKVGEGRLDLMQAINQPNRGFLRSVSLSAEQGAATVYCSFKLHECCPPGAEDDTATATPLPEETLEVGVGHLKLNNYEQTDGNHLYIEYSLLGHCGPELETDSVPKSEVMRFNHTKRLKVDENNAKHLEPMLKPHHAKTLRFLVLSEPCSLTQGTEIEEIGHADLNLMEEMVQKDQDVISTEIPVYDYRDQLLGSLSVTVIGNSTLQSYAEKQSSQS